MQQDIRNSGASSSLSANSPSFTSYSSENIADIAARVVHELNLSQNDDEFDDFYSSIHQHHDDNDDVDNDDVESEFEFAVLRGEDTSSPISADEIFHNGQIKPSYPLFNTSLIYGDHNDVGLNKSTTRLRAPLRKLMSCEDRENRNQSVSSSSSSENSELEGVPPESYCVWAPQKDAVTMKKKSNSTGTGVGSSKRWRLKGLLPRSSSDGKDSFVFLTSNDKRREKVTVVNNGGKKMEEVKKKSYLPYRQDLVGLFSNVNGLSRTIRPF